MKTTSMRQVYRGTIGDLKNLEQHYSEMAEKGWLIDKIGLLTHRYRAVEPGGRRFFVDLLPQITALDYPENENAQDYRRLCEESGWRFVTANKQFHVFCADEDTDAPIPIHTDNAIHAGIFLKASRKYELPVFLFSLVMLWFFGAVGKGAELLLSDILLFQAVGYVCFLPGYLWTLAFTLRWYARTRVSAKRGLPMPRVNRRLAKLRSHTFFAGLLLFGLCTLVGFALEIAGGLPIAIALSLCIPLSGLGVGLWIRKQIDTKRRTRAGNLRLTVAALVAMEVILVGGAIFAIMNVPVSADTESLGDRPALVLADVGELSEPQRSHVFIHGTAAVPIEYRYAEFGGGSSVGTQVYRAVHRTLTSWLYDHLEDEISEQFRERAEISGDAQHAPTVLSAEEAADWGAEAGVRVRYQSNAVELLLWRDRTILRVFADGANMKPETVRQAVRELWGER
jgi:hypothetical protein